MEMKEKLIVCPLPENEQDLLLEYLKEADLEELENLLKEDTVDINYIYKDTSEFIYEDKNALQIACAYFSADNIEKCIQLLLEEGADIFYKDPQTQKIALNFAAESGNSNVLEVILKYIDKKNIDIANSDVIYSLIKWIRDSGLDEEDFIASLKLLLNTDIDINYENVQSGWTTIYMAARYKFERIVQLIIDTKKSEINLDEFKDKKGKSARDLIIEQKLYKGDLPPLAEENSNITIFTLYKNIRKRATENFTENFEAIQSNLNESDKCKLLSMAVKYRLEKIVQVLLNNGINYGNSEEDIPMIIAAQRGYYKILKLFMSTKPSTELISQSLFELLKTHYTAEQSENVNYNRCLSLLLKSENLDINAKDYNGNTALHYALRYQDAKMALKILQKGASLASKDSFNKLAIADIDGPTLETHLNGCLRYENEEISTGKDACLRINYTSLLPVDNSQTENKNDYKIAVDVESQEMKDIFVPETEVLEYMCTSHELKQLLKHPVILSFLFLKWYRIAKFFYINLSLYLLFVISLLFYITFDYNIKDGAKNILNDLSYVLLVITFIILVVREVAQMILYKFKYFLTFENWLEIVLLISTIFILFSQSDKIARRQFSAIAIVAAAIEFLLLVGQFPSMSTNIMMLRTVSYTFFKLLLWYSILLVAFAYSFYTLFQENSEEKQNNNNSTKNDEDEEQDFFEDPGMSLLKTIVMLTGEFDASSIKFDTFPFTTHIIFVMFVFLITIVLFNLLNGLAVSDTQIIKNDAELYGQILRVEHIAHIERVLLGNKILQGLAVIKKICLFPLNTRKAEGLLYPNQNFKLILIQTGLPSQRNKSARLQCFRVFTGIYIDKKIQREIKTLMKEIDEEANRKKREDLVLTEIKSLKNVIQELIKKQS